MRRNGQNVFRNVFIEQLLRTGIPFNSGASHKNTKSTKMGKMFLKSVFTECCSGVRMVLDAHSGIIDYLCKRNMTKEDILRLRDMAEQTRVQFKERVNRDNKYDVSREMLAQNHGDY